MLRINFPGYSGEETLQEIDWDDFFEAFDENNLAFLHQDTLKGGETSRFFKFVERGNARGGRGRGRGGSSRSGGGRSGASSTRRSTSSSSTSSRSRGKTSGRSSRSHGRSAK
jgi:hypothetical protein